MNFKKYILFKNGCFKAEKLVRLQVFTHLMSYVLEMKERKFVCRANRLLLVKCYDNKKVKSPYNWVISPLTQPQTANQEKNIIFGWLCAVTSLVFT